MPIAIVGSVANGGIASGVTTGALNTTGATLLVAFIASYGGATAPALSDSKGNTWTQRHNAFGNNCRLSIWDCHPTTVGSGHTFSASVGNTYPTLLVVALSGALQPVAKDTAYSAVVAASGTSDSPGSFTPTVNDCLCLVGLCREGGTADSIDSGFTILQNVSYVNGQHFMGGLAYRLQSTAAAVNPVWGWTGSINHIISGSAWKAAAAAGITLTAAPGAYTIAGSAATFTRSRRLTAVPSTYALAGTAASLKRTIRLTADPGTYALAGTAASLTAPTSGLPTLPQAFVDTTMPAPRSGATTHVCTTGAQFTTALANAVLGDIIELTAGNTFAGPFTLPNKTPAAHSGNPDESEWIVIRSSAHASLPAEGTRVGPADVSNMATITTSGSPHTALDNAAGAHHLRFVGLRFMPASGVFAEALIRLGLSATSTANLPHHLIVDRCYIPGDPTLGGRRGLWFNAVHGAVIESYLSGWWELGPDTQAILVSNGGGPYLFRNNYLEAGAENIMFGGSDTLISNGTPSDITFTRNHCFKPLAWQANTSLTVKNLFELKHAQRVLIEGNLFENNWNQGQDGTAILFTVRNQDGSNPWAKVWDVTFQHNILRHTGSAFNLLGWDNLQTSTGTKRVRIWNNLITDVDPGAWGGPGRVVLFNDECWDVSFEHNTVLVSDAAHGPAHAGTWSSPNLIYRNNIVGFGTNGFTGDGTASGNDTLDTWFTDELFTHNLFADGNASLQSPANYPANTFFEEVYTDVGFSDFAGGNYRLAPASAYYQTGSDGADYGVDFDALDAAQGAAPSAVIATDNFDRADADTLGANWVQGTLLGILSNAVKAAVVPYFSTDGYGGTWPADHYASATLLALPVYYAGVLVRRQTYGTYYAAGSAFNDFADHRCVIWTRNAETLTILASTPDTILAVNDVVTLDIVGSTLTMKVNGVETLEVVDTSITAAGRPGLEIYHSASTVAFWDNFEGGGFGAPPTPLTAAPGAYTIAGSAASLRRGRRLVAAAGAYSLTGSAAGLVRTRRLIAAPGVYAMTGTPASLVRTRRLSAAPGAYAMAGSPASLTYTRRLTAQAGAYMLAGSAASLTRSIRLTASAGSVLWTGSPATLSTTTQLVLHADPGTYALAGSAAGLVRGRRLTATAGTYSMTGSAASLRRGRRLVATSGIYAWTGTAASLTRTVRLIAAPGAYSMTGSPASLFRDRRLIAAPGAYTMAGSPASLERSIRLAATAGVYVMAGSPAGLSTGRRLVAAPGVYALAGSPASFKRTVRLLASAGAYLWTGSAVISEFGLVLLAAPGAYVWAGMGILERAPPSVTDTEIALAFFAFDRPSRPPFWEGFDDPVELIRLGQRAIQGRPLRPPRDEGG